MRFFAGLFVSLFVATSAFANNDLIRNVTVITMDGDTVLQNASVRIACGRITAVGPASQIEPSTQICWTDEDLDQQQEDAAHAVRATRIIDGTGKFLIPGMAEMHGHLPFGGWDDARTEETLFLYLAGGVTTVRGMLGDPVQFELRDKIKAGELAGPTLYLAAPSLNGNTVSSVAEARAKTSRYHQQGWDLQKIHPGLSRAEFDAMAETANALGYPFGGHVPADVGIERALETGQISIDHMDGYTQWLDGTRSAYTQADLDRAVAITKKSGTWIVPTQVLFNLLRGGGDAETLLARPENRYMANSTVQTWARRTRGFPRNPLIIENRQKLLKAFADGGVNIAMGSDAPQVFSVPGFSIWREVEVMRDAGLTPQQILTAATSAPGRYFKGEDNFGTVTTGARADLILLDGDPREDITNLFRQAGVMAAGRWYSRAMIDEKLKEIAARHGN